MIDVLATAAFGSGLIIVACDIIYEDLHGPIHTLYQWLKRVFHRSEYMDTETSDGHSLKDKHRPIDHPWQDDYESR